MVQALELLYALGGETRPSCAVALSIFSSWLSLTSPPPLVLVCGSGPGVDSYGRLTQPLGLRMAEFPLSPMFAKMLLESGSCGCSKEISTIAAMMQIQNVLVLPANQKKAAVSVENAAFFHASLETNEG